jgi:hypothetical protein
MKVITELASISSIETTDALLETARASGRALVRVLLSVGAQLTDAERQQLQKIPDSVNVMVNGVAKSLRSIAEITLLEHKKRIYSDIFNVAEFAAFGIVAPTVPSTESEREQWNYTPTVTAALAPLTAINTPWLSVTIVSCDISELLQGTPFETGISADGKPVAITGLTRVDDGTTSTIRYRCLAGNATDEDVKGAVSKMRNGVFVDLSNGVYELGANAQEREAWTRKLNAINS